MLFRPRLQNEVQLHYLNASVVDSSSIQTLLTVLEVCLVPMISF